MTERILTVQWQSDAGHAWLGVMGNDLAAVGLREKDLSRYSYYAGNSKAPSVYWLEEDCDAGFFKEYAEKAGYELHYLPSREIEGDHPIRNMPRIRGESLLFNQRYEQAKKERAVQGAAMA